MNESKSTSETTEVVVENMDELLGTTASVTISADEESKKTVLDNSSEDTTFLDKPLEDGNDDEEKEKADTEESSTEEEKPETAADILDAELKEEEEDDEVETKSKRGRKPALVEAMSKLVEKGTLDLFEDQDDLSAYTTDDLVELIEQNINHKVDTTARQAPVDVFKRLDPKLQDVVAYALNGGADITNVLKSVARSQEVSELSLEDEKDQEKIIREWLRASDVMNDDEIEDEITSIADRGDLEKKATQFKPKLDKKQADIMEKKIAEQEENKKLADKAQQKYAEVIFKHLDNPTLNGIPLTNKTQTMLYHGLTDANYQDRNGNPTNSLGHLIEQYQFGENANPSILLEALWLMSDPQSYRTNVLSLGQQKAHTKTVRSLKTAEQDTTTSSNKQGDGGKAPSKRSVKRKTGSRNIFARD